MLDVGGIVVADDVGYPAIRLSGDTAIVPFYSK
jgi:hypothetical protein